MGLIPSLYVAGDHLACYGKAYFRYPTHTKASDSMGSFQFGVRCLDSCTDLVSVLPFDCLLEVAHVIPEANLGSNLQTKIPDGVAGLAAFSAMVGGSYRTLIEHRTGSSHVPIEDGMERTACGVVGA